MSVRTETAAVDIAGVVQGIVLVTIAAFVALATGVLSFAVAHRRPAPRTLHPAPPPHHAPVGR